MKSKFVFFIEFVIQLESVLFLSYSNISFISFEFLISWKLFQFFSLNF